MELLGQQPGFSLCTQTILVTNHTILHYETNSAHSSRCLYFLRFSAYNLFNHLRVASSKSAHAISHSYPQPVQLI